MDVNILKEQVDRCRRLAKHADPSTAKRLLDLAAEYEERIRRLASAPHTIESQGKSQP
jgi:hypothetical protein